MKTLAIFQRCLFIGACAFNVQAMGAAQDLAVIERSVVNYIEKQYSPDDVLNVVLQRLDSRLLLSRCENDLIISWSPGSQNIGRTTLSVACTKPKPWRIFVRASVEKEQFTWVLNAAVRKGEILTQAHVSQQSVMLGRRGLHGLQSGLPIKKIEPWLGRVFVRAMQAGNILNDSSLELPDLVSKGDMVSINYESSHLAVKAKGVALESGALEQSVAVKNSVSNKVINAIVTGRSSVTITR